MIYCFYTTWAIRLLVEAWSRRKQDLLMRAPYTRQPEVSSLEFTLWLLAEQQLKAGTLNVLPSRAKPVC